jgi:hypothetical protein
MIIGFLSVLSPRVDRQDILPFVWKHKLHLRRMLPLGMYRRHLVHVPETFRVICEGCIIGAGLEEESTVEKIPLHIFQINGTLLIHVMAVNNMTGEGTGGGMANEVVQTLMISMNGLEVTAQQNFTLSKHQFLRYGAYCRSNS